MKAEAMVKTTVTVDLEDFATADLIDELEARGHAVDSDCAYELDTLALLDGLSSRQLEDFARVPLGRLIDALGKFGCPADLVAELREWERQPVPTKDKLNRWLALSGGVGCYKT